MRLNSFLSIIPLIGLLGIGCRIPTSQYCHPVDGAEKLMISRVVAHAAPTENSCEEWRVDPTDDPLTDVRLARTGKTGDDLKESIALL